MNKSISLKDLGEAAYILGIKIYRDRSRRLIGLYQSTYLDKILKKFKMDQSKKGFLPVLQGVKLSETQCPTTTEDREKMKVIPYASATIMYAMLCTRPDVCLAISLAGRYQCNPGVDHVRSGTGGAQTCLPAGLCVAPPTAQYGPASLATAQDPRGGPILARRTTPRPPWGQPH